MNLESLPPEARFLLVATREPAFDSAGLRSLAAQDLDWPMVRALTVQERLSTVLWPRMLEAGIDPPPDQATAFRLQASVTEFRLSLAELTLRHLARTAADLGIELTLLKGAALALGVYGGFRHRPMGDLDVLTRPHDAVRLFTRLREVDGWRLEYDDGEAFYDDHQHLPPLVTPSRDGGIVVEVHRSLFPPRAPFGSGDDAGTTRMVLDEGPVWILDPESQMLHLSVHFAWSHALARGLGRTVRDVAAVTAHSAPDWDALVVLAERTRASTCVYWTLRLARSLGGAAIPDGVLDLLRPARPEWLLDRLERAYVENALFRSCPSRRIAQTFWAIGIDPRRSRHGNRRPWSADDRFRAEVAREGGPRSGLSHRFHRIPAAVAYLRRTLGGSLGGRPVDIDD